MSSNGFTGMGGFDLFCSTLQDSVWSVPENLGAPLNSFKDEVGLVISADGKKGFYAKEHQKKQTIVDSRLVTFEVPESLTVDAASYVVGTVRDATTKQPIRANIEVVDLVSNKQLYSSHSDAISGQYFMVLPTGREMAAYVKKQGYLFVDFHFQPKSSSLLAPDTVDLELSPIETGKRIVLKNIYFKLDSYQLSESSFGEIEQIAMLLEHHPSLEVEIAGHTDQLGNATYNERLSTLRAKAVYEALIQKGASPEMLSYKGYGESQPLSSSDTQGKEELNRRIEFRVLRASK